MSDPIFAVVVTFHPDLDVSGNLRELSPQVDGLIIVDNGSTASELMPLRDVSVSLGFEIIENGCNLGIATALNIGIRRALAFGAGWILLFDQDSRVTPGFVSAMLGAFRGSSWGERLGLLVPRYLDQRNGMPIPPEIALGEGLEVAMTSGSLLRRETFERHGLFVDELFIDVVDHEFSLRLRKAGLILDECQAAVLLHSPGTPRLHSFRGKVRFQTANYSPLRRYYQERNKIWLYRRYRKSFPKYCRRMSLVSLKDFVKILLYESCPGKKAAYFLRGIVDGLRERMGPFA